MERLRENVPDRVLAVFNENYGKPVGGDKISEAVWGNNCRISDHYIHALVKRCRSFVPEKVNGADREDPTLYSLYHSTSYMLTNRLEVGSWVSMPFEQDNRMGILSVDDLDLIHQREVRLGYRLISRISPSEHELLGNVCGLSSESGSGYVSTKQLAMACFRFADEDELDCIRNSICRLKKKIGCLISVEIQSEPKKGYRIVKKSS